MKLNNKGFAISTVMYMILIMAVVLITLTLSILSVRKLILDKIRVEASNNIYNVYSISYRTALEILKSEAIEYATTNNVEKESIMIGDLNSSIDKEILDGYKLSEKYLTMISNDGSYDVYLGKSKTVTNLNESIDNLIDIVDYKIEGNSYQETRSGKNLFDIFYKTEAEVSWASADNTSARSFEFDKFYVGLTSNNYYNSNNVSYRIDGDSIFVSSSSNGYGVGVPIEVESNTIYTISGGSDTSVLGIGQYDGDGNYIADNSIREITLTKKTFTTAEDTKIIVVVLRPDSNSGEIEYKNIQLEKGSTATEYEEYGAMPSLEYPSEIQSVGNLVTDSSDSNYGKYEIPIKATGKNLVNIEDIHFQYTGFYTNTSSNPNLLLEPNTTYTISFDYVVNSSDYLVKCGIGYGTSTYAVDIIYGYTYPNQENGKFELTFTTPSEFDSGQTPYLQLRLARMEFSGYIDVNVSNIQLEKGAVATDYTPYVEPITSSIYLAEPLRCIEDKCDYIDFVNQKVVRKIKEISFTGEETWSKYSSVDNHYQIVVGDNLFFNTLENYVLSNYYIAHKLNKGYYSDKDYAVMSVDGSRIRFKNKDISDLDSWIDFVSSKKEKGVPLTTIYALSESKEETIELPKINLDLLSTNVYINTSIKPSSVELTAIQKIKQI